ncbi:MAG: tRNA uridine-5-carboxymethylaminomethyl(34) synthesis GTPase MnmE [Bacteroidia bacterium]|nr:tRNA uridine-5-carboxymethylaminomethyl(34) synthesis GTPase MnmE [Bacteroidia bacterium]
MVDNSVICALATPQTTSAISLIRVSGNNCFEVVSKIILFQNKSKTIQSLKGYTLHRAQIIDNNEIIDDVLISIFINPVSYTGEDMIEISCHGSTFIQQRIINLLTLNGARHASPGEFTLRAFLNGKIDLSQAEAIADLISSQNKASHDIAMNQVRGGFKKELDILREKLLNLVSLIELELDFSEEDVEFADRTILSNTIKELLIKIKRLKNSFELGNAIKNGIPVTIAGNTNVGKSTLLNAILNEEKAIVSDIHGTTRDVIEDTIVYKGISFRFADTAGFRDSKDEIENIGISRSISKIKHSKIILLLVDVLMEQNQIEEIYKSINSELNESQNLILILNKTDLISNEKLIEFEDFCIKLIDSNKYHISLSAKDLSQIDKVLSCLYKSITKNEIFSDEIVVSINRHFDALSKSEEALLRAKSGLQNKISNDFLSQDLKEVLHHIGSITGEITTNEILGNIFKNFCIGK